MPGSQHAQDTNRFNTRFEKIELASCHEVSMPSLYACHESCQNPWVVDYTPLVNRSVRCLTGVSEDFRWESRNWYKEVADVEGPNFFSPAMWIKG